MSEEYKLHKVFSDKDGNKLFLESTKGYFRADVHKREKDFEDRKFTIRVNDSKRFAFSHDAQLSLLTSVLENDILPQRFIQNCEKFLHKIYEIKGKRRKLERENYNVDLSDFTQKNLWNCGGNNENKN